jgi:hypothetical protein
MTTRLIRLATAQIHLLDAFIEIAERWARR